MMTDDEFFQPVSDTELQQGRLRRVAPGITVRNAVDNMAWAKLDEFVIVVDALEQPELWEDVEAGIRESADNAPVRYVLNTHTHYDHVALNDAFRRAYGSEIVNHRDTPLPQEGRWFGAGGRRVGIVPVPGCHSSYDCMVWFPEDGVLFVGDVFGWGLIPWDGLLTNAKCDLIRTTYRRFIDMGPQCIVPGHGPLCSTAHLQRWLLYFDWLTETVLNAHAQQLGQHAIRAALPPPEDMADWWRFLSWKHEDSVAKVLKAVQGGALVPS